ncbi:hypothetical protein ABW20_dc0103134 [Dactylellina cionopaga]|nr:hypothetical protein ABW20_dc0103134 [Dactylellina cionopaga]
MAVIFADYGPGISGDHIAIPSITSMTMLSQFEEGAEETDTADALMTGFVSTLSGLTSYTYSMCHPMKAQPMKPFIPKSITSPNLTSLTVRSIFLSQDKGRFLAILESLPSLTSLDLDTVLLDLLNGNLLHAPSNSWANTFLKILKALPNLTAFSAKRLMYGREIYRSWASGPKDAMVYVPREVSYNPGSPIAWYEEFKNTELVSPYKGDWLNLGVFKRQIAERNGKSGPEATVTAGTNWPHLDPHMWQLVEDRSDTAKGAWNARHGPRRWAFGYD